MTLKRHAIIFFLNFQGSGHLAKRKMLWMYLEEPGDELGLDSDKF